MSLSDAIKHGNKGGCNELTQSELLQITQAACGCVNGTLREWPLLNRSFKKLGVSLPLDTHHQELKKRAKEVLTYCKK
ncbi:hypothetical protein JI57_04630 [Psychromonas sp. PRT-SC03]|nr:hypothetical protein JI57_04630 [Psychromonas sp. PRT-SC03]